MNNKFKKEIGKKLWSVSLIEHFIRTLWTEPVLFKCIKSLVSI